jgi:photosystem II stability/assembly factor-like uncharacterized protein
VWENVTPSDMALGDFGVGNIVVDPARPSDLYAGGYGALWKSTDYGLTWKKLDTNPSLPSVALGHIVAVAGTTPATVWVANIRGPNFVYRSTDGGLNFTATGQVPENPSAESFYSIKVDPNDPTHLLTGLHERDGVLESTDSGDTWHFVNGPGWPQSGISWFIFFVNTGDPATTRNTWLAIAQSGGSGMITQDAGKTWTVAKGLEKLEHPHGVSQLFQQGNNLFISGIYGSSGDGVFRSTDFGQSFTRVVEGYYAAVWGSDKYVYTGWGWACSRCSVNPDDPLIKVAPQPGDMDTWTKVTRPAGLNWGPNSVAITSDGSKTIYVGSMWATGLWRYVEP